MNMRSLIMFLIVGGWGELGKATWMRDLTMALGISWLEKGREENGGLVFLTQVLLPSMEH